MIQLLVNKRTVVLSLATSHIAHLCNLLNHVALPIFVPRFKRNIFYQNSFKIKLFFAKKCKIFERWGLCPKTPETVPSIANFWLRACPHMMTLLVEFSNTPVSLSAGVESIFSLGRPINKAVLPQKG